MDYREYRKELGKQYEQYGDFALLEGKIQAFIKTHRYNVQSDKVRSDLEKIVKWNELVHKIAVIDNVQSYLSTLELFYAEFGDNMLDLEVRNEFVTVFQLDTKFQIDSVALKYDILEIRKGKECDDHRAYIELLKQYYKKYGDEMFLSSKMHEFRQDCISKNLPIDSYDITEDLRKIRKPTNDSILENTETITDAQNNPEYKFTWKAYRGNFKEDVEMGAENLSANFRRTTYRCPICGRHIHKREFPTDTEFSIKTATGFVPVKRLFTCKSCLSFYAPMPGQKISCGQFFSIKMTTPAEYDLLFEIYDNYGVQNKQQTNNKSDKRIVSPMQTTDITPPIQTQSQTASQTPPVQAQSKQVITEDTEPPQSFLDIQTLFDYVKAMPVKWGYANPNVTPTKELQQLCNSFLTSWEIPKCYSPDSIQGMEYIIQKKRARTPDKADYNKVMETNMLFELYNYSYSMNIIKVLVDRKNDTVEINMSELMGLIQEDCRRHLSNLEYEKRNNPAIQDMLQKYNHDTQKVKMIINDYVEGREYDYIFSSLMTSTLMNIVNYILNTEMETAKGYQPTLQVVRQYPSSDLTAALDAYITSIIGIALNSYTNGGSIPRKPQ